MTPGGTSDEKLMVEQVERLGARRLAEIVVNHCHRDERLHQTVRIALAASTLGGPLVKTLATEIDAVRASRHFYGYRESNVLAQELGRIRQGITEYLLPAQPRAAAELLGRTEDAQAVRWSIFATSLSADILDEYLGRLPEDVVAEARQRAIATACRHPDVHQSLALLAELSPDIAAELVHMRLGEIRGEAYWTLRPVAERLRESHPVAAILLYRQMADAVLQRSQSQYYDHAVRDLIAAERLVPKVEDWLGHRPQEAYRQQVATEHRQKRALWERMGRAGLSWRQ